MRSASTNPASLRNSPRKTLIVALFVSLICSVIVSTAYVVLQPLHVANMEKEQERQLLDILKRQPGIREMFETVNAQDVEVRLVELATGQYMQEIDPHAFDPRKAERDPELSVTIPANLDIAQLKRRATYAPVYLVRKDGSVKIVILPIHGKGHFSTLYGYIALDTDANTVIGLSFYQHGETPGLGAKVSAREWLDQWYGKKVRDADGVLRIGVARGEVATDSPAGKFEVDGITGATGTSRGVHNTVRYWLGDQGFGPYLSQFGAQQVHRKGQLR